jgi:hypothetical protein
MCRDRTTVVKSGRVRKLPRARRRHVPAAPVRPDVRETKYEFRGRFLELSGAFLDLAVAFSIWELMWIRYN